MSRYIQRTLARVVQEVSTDFKVILLTGPRQVGKTTLLRELEPENRTYVTLDDLNMRMAAQQDPASFLERFQQPMLIDEVQYAPNLFPYIKMVVDQAKQPGMFWLTGSQQFDMMQNITESLAGRAAILHLQGISLAEEQGYPDLPPFLPDPGPLKHRQQIVKPLTLMEAYHKIWRGSYPDMVLRDGQNWERFYESYVTTYIQRDVREYLNIHDMAVFYKFMQIAAARSGQLINYADMARDTGVSQVTLKSWLAALRASGIIYQLPPYFNNRTQRLIKTPKLYFMDTGLCCFLTGWLTPDVLERGAMAGAMLETWVVSEIVKSYLHQGRMPRLYFYRDKDKREVDLLIEENGMLWPLEIKKTASIQNARFQGFEVLQHLKTPIGHGGLICFVNSLLPVSRTVDAIPISLL